MSPCSFTFWARKAKYSSISYTTILWLWTLRMSKSSMITTLELQSRTSNRLRHPPRLRSAATSSPPQSFWAPARPQPCPADSAEKPNCSSSKVSLTIPVSLGCQQSYANRLAATQAATLSTPTSTRTATKTLRMKWQDPLWSNSIMGASTGVPHQAKMKALHACSSPRFWSRRVSKSLRRPFR